MVEITGESIKGAIGRELRVIIPEATLYREAITNVANLRFPHIFTNQLSIGSYEERRGYYWLTYLVNLRYRHVSDPITSSTLQENLDRVGLLLTAGLQRIRIGEVIIPIKEARYEKVDGVLQFFCNITIQITQEQFKGIEMETLEIGLQTK